YGIFLMHRMREECLDGAEPGAAALTALRTTGGGIASAGLLPPPPLAGPLKKPLGELAEPRFVVPGGGRGRDRAGVFPDRWCAGR
ncbi:MMPL family transporter, partial [Streptomyces sp. WM6349]|uniref:MMPL family transporter n=1 Tax=Streptomyces sp. WM6349 TaxID=1415552 RepID=UPI0006C12D57